VGQAGRGSYCFGAIEGPFRLAGVLDWQFDCRGTSSGSTKVDGHRTRGLTLRDSLNHAGNVICVSATTMARQALHGRDCFGRRAHTDFASRIGGIDVYVHVYGSGGNLHLGLDLMEIEGLFIATIDIRYFALTGTPIAPLF
jgi:hypothetical protein